MIRLLYLSHASQDLPDHEIEKILLQARQHNKAQDITGALMLGGGLFMQVLEGPEQAVLRLYVKILDDKRHKDSRIIHVAPVKGRLFQNWSMGFIDSNPLDFKTIAEIRGSRHESVSAEAFSDVMKIFENKLLETKANTELVK